MATGTAGARGRRRGRHAAVLRPRRDRGRPTPRPRSGTSAPDRRSGAGRVPERVHHPARRCRSAAAVLRRGGTGLSPATSPT